MTEHKPYHERSLDQQILDALLRIEALLNKARTSDALSALAEDDAKLIAEDYADALNNPGPSVAQGASKGQQKGRRK